MKNTTPSLSRSARPASALKDDTIRQAVREQYGKAAEGEDCGCAPSCCGAPSSMVEELSQSMGYSQDETSSVPQGANLGLGCGNPQAIAQLKPGETVLDLGSGAGFDVFLASRRVGVSGRVIGIDMTSAMITKARANATKGGFKNVEFRLGEIENLPVADASVDVIMSNCVINLSPDKPRVFSEAFRALKPGGRLAIADVVAFAELPNSVKNDMALYTGCMAGASLISDLEEILRDAGFSDVKIAPKDESRQMIRQWAPGTAAEDHVVSANIQAVRPIG